eukprot:CAMPEP_0119149652 /NCGR_PEP_ID=MMETSP1310-20130426/43663_1 /TAXON_ID=464262 /ORGANISM="Genus nov. species nov., Strain RCC2339" /LENGTH=156 /DNA_ID=CAMNT_0007141775 /DNA_START=288 /DNA_END=755 /DNA_ORIENTATION=-
MYTCNLADLLQARWASLEAGQGGYFSVCNIASFIYDITKGLRFLHENRVIHRDIKPANIFVIRSGRGEISSLVLGDFDSAKEVEESGVAHTRIGTPLFMAPEVLSSDVMEYSFSSDIYSVGLVIFEMITLRHPHFDINPSKVGAAVFQGRKPTLPK